MNGPDTHVYNRYVAENGFLKMAREEAPLPLFAASRSRLPQPFWEGNEAAIACYWKAWEIAFGNLRKPPEGSPLIANFIDTAFNDCSFLWDSCFMTLFGRYGARAFGFQRTLDNFYARQHWDGFICREIGIAEGDDRFERHDPASTGPNLFAWAEWEYYEQFGDRARLAAVFPVLLAYNRWMRVHRTWPDGSAWSCGLGCGMDNQPRLPDGYDLFYEHGHQAWIDATLQQILSNQMLLRMARELGREADTVELATETANIAELVNHGMWDEARGFYVDRRRNGTLSPVRTIGAYWALLAGIVPPQRLARFLAPLSDSAEFARPHRIPTLPASDPYYDPKGGYWLGGVWAPTNYMVLRGLHSVGNSTLAHEIARNHLASVVRVFQETGTLWENYAPERDAPGNPARKDFVGWTGLGPIAVLFESIFGLRPAGARNELTWDVRLLEGHGVASYPLGSDTNLHLRVAARRSDVEEPRIEASADRPVTLFVKWKNGAKTVVLEPGTSSS